MKSRRKTKGLQTIAAPIGYKEPTPAERCERAAEHLLRESVEANPRFKATAKKIARAVQHGAAKLVRAMPKKGEA